MPFGNAKIGRMIRVLRLAAAAVCLLACVALGVLWHRSYSWAEGSWTRAPYASIMSARGLLIVRVTGNPLKEPFRYADFAERMFSEPVQPSTEALWWEEDSRLGFLWVETPPGGTWINAPHWTPILVMGALAVALAWKGPFRFNLRRLFIVTTLFALAMGLCIALGR